MSRVAAIVVESLRARRLRRTWFAMCAVLAFPIAFCFGLSFELLPADQVLRDQAGLLAPDPTRLPIEATYSIGSVEPVTAGLGWGTDLEGGYRIDIRVTTSELDRIAIEWFERWHDGVPEGIDGEQLRLQFLRQRFELFGYECIEVHDDSEVDDRIEIAVKITDPNTVRRAYVVRLYGVLEGILPVSRRAYIESVQGVVSRSFLGFLGILVALLACSSLVSRGLGAPVSAPERGPGDRLVTLLLARYVAGVSFFFSLACVGIGGSWVALAAGCGHADPWFLVPILTTTLEFAALFAIAALVGVWTGRAGLATLAAAAAWLASAVWS